MCLEARRHIDSRWLILSLTLQAASAGALAMTSAVTTGAAAAIGNLQPVARIRPVAAGNAEGSAAFAIAAGHTDGATGPHDR